MAEKVAKLGVTREKDFMYYVKDGAVWKVQRKQPGVPKGKSEKVADGNFQMDTDFIYFVDKEVVVKADNGAERQSISCGDGGYVLSGGSRTVKGRSANVEMKESFPDTAASWTLAVTNRGDKKAGDATVRLTAVCIKK